MLSRYGAALHSPTSRLSSVNSLATEEKRNLTLSPIDFDCFLAGAIKTNNRLVDERSEGFIAPRSSFGCSQDTNPGGKYGTMFEWDVANLY